MGFALYRRLVLHPKRLEGDDLEHTDALIILSMIMGLMVTLVLFTAMELIVDPQAYGAEKVVSRPLAMVLGYLLSPGAATAGYHVFWWAHALLILAFLNYLPYSKHLHVASSLINVYFSNTSGPGQKGVMRPMDLEADVEQFGASDVEHLSWKNLLDGYSCTECGRCTAACPANITGKPLSPRKIVVNTRQRLMEKAPVVTGDRMEFMRPALLHGEGDDAGATTVEEVMGHRLLDTYITEEELWACTSCRACVTECPVSIDQLDVINQLRRNLVLTESTLPGGAAAGVHLARAQRLTMGVPGVRPRGDGRKDCTSPTMAELAERGEQPGHPLLGRLHGVVRRPGEEDHGRLRAHHAGVRHQVRHPRAGGELPRRSGTPHGQRVPVPDAGEGHDRDAGPLRGARRSSRIARTASIRSATSSRSSAATTR